MHPALVELSEKLFPQPRKAVTSRSKREPQAAISLDEPPSWQHLDTPGARKKEKPPRVTLAARSPRQQIQPEADESQKKARPAPRQSSQPPYRQPILPA